MVPLSTLYSNAPVPVAFTSMVPVGVAQVGWVTVGDVITGLAVKLITTSSVLGEQGALLIVHLNVYVVPATPVNVEVGLDAVVTLPPAPDMILQAPVPTVGVLAARVTEVAQTV